MLRSLPCRCHVLIFKTLVNALPTLEHACFHTGVVAALSLRISEFFEKVQRKKERNFVILTFTKNDSTVILNN